MADFVENREGNRIEEIREVFVLPASVLAQIHAQRWKEQRHRRRELSLGRIAISGKRAANRSDGDCFDRKTALTSDCFYRSCGPVQRFEYLLAVLIGGLDHDGRRCKV